MCCEVGEPERLVPDHARTDRGQERAWCGRAVVGVEGLCVVIKHVCVCVFVCCVFFFKQKTAYDI